MVEVFKTNVTDTKVADKIISDLAVQLPESKINFDLTDCDHILRIESKYNSVIKSVLKHMKNLGHFCEVLE